MEDHLVLSLTISTSAKVTAEECTGLALTSQRDLGLIVDVLAVNLSLSSAAGDENTSSSDSRRGRTDISTSCRMDSSTGEPLLGQILDVLSKNKCSL